jgi:hypothetical protein
MLDSFDLALSRPDTGRLLQATSGKAEKVVHECAPGVKNRIARKRFTKETPICQIEYTDREDPINGLYIQFLSRQDRG